ncbi:MAG TPA: hypothetical protein VN257_03505 [Actinotalea sp.]|nr:hypothetical protein [Actinotalea sp.]
MTAHPRDASQPRALAVVELVRGPEELPVHVLDNGDLRLAFLPTVGGRLISVRCGGVELLWRNPGYLDDALRTIRPRSTWAPLDGTMGSWANVGGSKTWPAPQGWTGPHEWPGPPDDVLDSGPWALTWSSHDDGGVTVTMTSPDDPRTGPRAVRAFEVPAAGTRFRHRSTFTNVVDRPVRWSVWEVCQVDTALFAAGGTGTSVLTHPDDVGVFVGVTGRAEPVRIVDLVGAMEVGEATGGVRHVPVRPVVAKVGFVDASGTLELRRPDGAGIVWQFDVPTGTYPDGGCQVELWMQHPLPEPLPGPGALHPDAHLVELEVLTPIRNLEPGDEVTLEIVWDVRGTAV